MLLDLDDLGFLEDVRATGKTLEGFAHLLDLDDLGFLEDVRATGKTLKRFAHLLDLLGGENRAQFSNDTLLGRGGEHRAQFSNDTLLGRGDGGKELAGALVVTRAVALRADHLVRLRE
jgi:hypothetical protein